MEIIGVDADLGRFLVTALAFNVFERSMFQKLRIPAVNDHRVVSLDAIAGIYFSLN